MVKGLPHSVIMRLFQAGFFLASFANAAIEDIAFCGECFCIPDAGERCPVTMMPQVEFPPEMIASFRSIRYENPILLDCDPYANSACTSNPPLEEGGACVAEIIAPPDGVCPGDYSYRLSTVPSKDIAQANFQYVTHEGPCGVCSSFQDLAVYLETPDLASVGINCGIRLLNSFEDAIACYMETGFSEPCATLWAANTRRTNEVCRTPCIQHAFSGLPNNGPPPTCELVECLVCDDIASSAIFNLFAGRTRRNSGLLSAIVRPCGELSNIVHIDPCEVNLNRLVCESSIAETEAFGPEFGTVCECSAIEEGNALLTCIDTTCLGCNEDLTVCGQFSFGSIFGASDFIIFSIVEYVNGRSDVLRFTETTDGCTFQINDEQCSQCSFITCEDGSDGVVINCEDDPSITSINTCTPNIVDTGPFQVFNIDAFDECVTPGQLKCQQARESIERFGVALGSRCNCELDGDDVTAVCSDTTCEYCNNDESACAQTSYGTIFDAFTGKNIGSAGSARFILGGSEEVIIREKGGESCSVTVDGEECASCDPVICEDPLPLGVLSIRLDCSNIPGGTVFSSCDSPLGIDGPLQIFNQNQFETCNPRAPSFIREACQSSLAGDCACVESDVPGSPISGGRFSLSCANGDRCFCADGSQQSDACTSHISRTTYDPPLAEISAIEDVVNYVIGRDDEVRLMINSCTGTGNDCPFQYSCTIEVNGVQCSSCELCDEYAGGFGIRDDPPTISFDCSNIELGASYDLCLQPPDLVPDGVFRFLSNDDCDAMCTGLFLPCETSTDCCSGRCAFGRCRTAAKTSLKNGVKLAGRRGGAAGGGRRLRIRGL